MRKYTHIRVMRMPSFSELTKAFSSDIPENLANLGEEIRKLEVQRSKALEKLGLMVVDEKSKDEMESLKLKIFSLDEKIAEKRKRMESLSTKKNL